jgi:hypothetical protein
MTIVIPGWAIVVGFFALLTDSTEAPKAPVQDIPVPIEFWFLFWGVLVFAFLLGGLIDHLLKENT